LLVLNACGACFTLVSNLLASGPVRRPLWHQLCQRSFGQ
jgi:hypothetical protein